MHWFRSLVAMRLSVLYKLHRKGLNAVCIPRSLENDIAATMVSLGFNSALSFTIEMLDRAREAARASRQIGVVEVQGEQAGWLALQAGVAAGADVILIPELANRYRHGCRVSAREDERRKAVWPGGRGRGHRAGRSFGRRR